MFREAALKARARLGRAAARPAGAGHAERHRRVPRRHRAAGVGRPAGRAAGAVSRRASRTRRSRATIWRSCCARSATTRVAVELRHKSWSDAIGDTLSLLNAFGAALVQIDEPKFRFSIRQNYLPNVTSFYYMRLHGRNAAQWWRHDDSRGPLQLPVLGERAAGVRGHGRRGAGAGARSRTSTRTTTSPRSRWSTR